MSNLNTIARKTDLTDFRYKDEHRTLDGRFKMIDLDGIFHDDNFETHALIETKHYWKKTLTVLEQNQLKVLTNLAERAKLPLFYIFYYYPGVDDYSKVENLYGNVWRFKVFPINDLAKETLSQPKEMTKRQYAEFEYAVRKILPSPYYLSTYDNTDIVVPFIKTLSF